MNADKENDMITRSAILCCALLGPLGVAAQAPAPPWANYSVVDMTHSFDTDTIYWPTEEGFQLETGFDGITDGGYYYASNRYAAADHGGTHLDAPKQSSVARANRLRLRDVMTGHGFEPLNEEWWHFTLREEPYPDSFFDFPIR
jgi:hypothetical protein